MAELSREASVLVPERQFSAEDYAQAALLYENTLFPFRRYQARAGICIHAVMLVASVIPWYLSQFTTTIIPICTVVFFLALTLYFWREQPRRRFHGPMLQFRSSGLSCLPDKIPAYRNGIVLENDAETLSELWTDFSGCVEGHAYYALWGDISRPLLVLKKSVLSPEQAECLSTRLRSAFAGRCHLEDGGRFR